MTACSLTVLCLPGDGIGPEVVAAALEVLLWLRPQGVRVEPVYALYGGACYDATGTFVAEETIAAAGRVDAILCGAEGGPRWDDVEIDGPPEKRSGLSRLRRELDLFANLRPVRAWQALRRRGPLRRRVTVGSDFVVVRELTSGIYFGQPREICRLADGQERAVDTQAYTTSEIERVAREALTLARGRNRRLASVDKANVMMSGVLWRRVVTAVRDLEFADVELEHLYADNALFQVVRSPRRFDVILADNLFGDLLSDCAGVISGSLGMLPSASFGPVRADGTRAALYEPVHGSAPDIAGQGVANPIGAILSVGLLLERTANRSDLAQALVRAVEQALASGVATPDVGGAATTAEMTAAVIGELSGTLGTGG